MKVWVWTEPRAWFASRDFDLRDSDSQVLPQAAPEGSVLRVLPQALPEGSVPRVLPQAATEYSASRALPQAAPEDSVPRVLPGADLAEVSARRVFGPGGLLGARYSCRRFFSPFPTEYRSRWWQGPFYIRIIIIFVH